MKTGAVMLALVFAVLAVCLLARSATAPKTALFIVVDFSGSTESERKQQQAVVATEVEAAPPNSELTLFRMGYTTEELLSGSLDETPVESVVGALKKGTDHSDHHKGTNFANMAEALAGAVGRSKAEHIRIEAITDGGDDFATDQAARERYVKAARQICEDKRVEAVAFIGVESADRSVIRTLWAGAGGRLQVLDASQVSTR